MTHTTRVTLLAAPVLAAVLLNSPATACNRCEITGDSSNCSASCAGSKSGDIGCERINGACACYCSGCNMC